MRLYQRAYSTWTPCGVAFAGLCLLLRASLCRQRALQQPARLRTLVCKQSSAKESVPAEAGARCRPLGRAIAADQRQTRLVEHQAPSQTSHAIRVLVELRSGHGICCHAREAEVLAACRVSLRNCERTHSAPVNLLTPWQEPALDKGQSPFGNASAQMETFLCHEWACPLSRADSSGLR